MHGVVRLSEYGEDARHAFHSVAANASEFKQLYMVCPSFEEGREPFQGYEECAALLKECGVPLRVVGELDTRSLPKDVKGRLLEIHPYAVHRKGAFPLLDKRTELVLRPGYEHVRHYGLTSILDVAEDEEKTLTHSMWDALTGYGFILVMHWIDMFWRVYSRGKYYTERDMQAHMVVNTYQRTYVPSLSWPDRIWNRSTLPAHSGRSTTICRTPPTMSGWGLARYLVGIHKKQTWGLWWLVFIFVGYYWFGLPWWNALSTSATAVFVRPMFGPLNVVLYLLNTAVLVFGTHHSLRVPQLLVLSILFPVYVTLYPLFWLYARSYSPKLR